jgi:uncharacterized repeat protein (TIGR02543 family)
LRLIYVARVSFFLITLALILGMVGCVGVEYDLTIASTAGGSVITPGERTCIYDQGIVVSLVAEAEEGYRFVKWTGDVETIANVNAASTTITMNGDYSITATFVAVYDLNISSTAAGSVTLPGEGAFTYDAGTVVSLTAAPASGYQFVNWTGDVGTVANVNAASTTITMNGDYSIAANFVAVYDLTISSTAGGSVTLPGEGAFTYDAGTVVSLTAAPTGGYHFVNWTGDVSTVANVNVATTTITMNGDYSIAANFVMVYDLTISSTAGGSVTTPGEGTFIYDAGTVVSLVANPLSGYHFVKWTGDVSTVANINAASTTITMNGDYSITANFVAVYDLNISSTAGGSVTLPGEGAFTYDAGTVVSLTAAPATGYQFVKWTGDVGTIANINTASTIITMNGDYSITANFEAIPAGKYRLTISSSGCGYVNTPGEGIYAYDEGIVVELVANPVGDNSFVEWTGDVSTIADVEDATTNITMYGDYAITATFLCEGGLCFVATAAYGTPMAKEIEILREFRDKYLMTNPVGKGMVEFYYRVSPPIAEFITEHPSLKPIVRSGLLPVVAMSTVAVNTTPTQKVAIISLLVLVSVAVAVWATRQRSRRQKCT